MIYWNENAKAAVREFADYIGQSDKGERYLEHVAPKKTVADAVEYYKENGKICGYSFSQNKMLSFCKSSGTYCFVSEKSSAGSVDTDDWQPICTREQFEAYVKEQEVEKWTHVYTDDTGTDIRCVLLAEHGEWVWVKDAGTVDTICKSWLKPIKPTMTKEQQKMVAKFVARIYTIESSYNLRDEFDKFCNEHDII